MKRALVSIGWMLMAIFSFYLLLGDSAVTREEMFCGLCVFLFCMLGLWATIDSEGEEK